MKKFLAIASMGLLVSCTTTFTLDGSAATIGQIRTEYQLVSGEFVGCDSAKRGGLLGILPSTSTQVVVPFSVSGIVSSVDIELKGSKTGNNNGFQLGIPATKLKQLSDNAQGTNRFEVSFNANSVFGKPLPASIIVNPTAHTIKHVTANEPELGSFYVNLTLNTPSGRATATSQLVSKIQVFANCSIIEDTGVPLQ